MPVCFGFTKVTVRQLDGYRQSSERQTVSGLDINKGFPVLSKTG